jgi:hypothetical protein
MQWYTVVESEPHGRLQNSENEEIALTSQFLASSNKPKQLSLEHQFFIAPFVLVHSNASTILPIRTLETLSVIHNHLVPNFDRCIAFYRGDKPVAVHISTLNASAKEQFEQLLQNNQLHPLVTDLYGDKVKALDQSTFGHPTTIYQIDTKILGTGDTIGVDSLSRIICETFLSNEGHFTVVPVGWTFGDHLLHSSYLKFIATICNDIYLHVRQNDQTVVAISGFVTQ